LKLSENQFNLFPCIRGKEIGSTISFDQLVQKIKTPSQVVAFAREYRKGSTEYDEIKVNSIECFYPNQFNSPNYKSPRYTIGTGYVYLDIDCPSKEEAVNFRNQLTKQHPFITACWFSLSELGLGMLVKVENGGEFFFEQYWSKLNDIIEGVDPATKNYNRLNAISHDPSIYVNKECATLDSQYKFNQNSIYYSTPIPDIEFENINTPVIYVGGKDVLEINLFPFKKRKVQEGYRNKTIGRIGSMLIALNPKAEPKQLESALLSINNNYCYPPQSSSEVLKSFNSNYKKYNKGQLNINKFLTSKTIFWHPLCQLNRKERTRIGRMKLSHAKLIQREKLVLDTMEILESQNLPINAKTIMEYTLMKKSVFYKTLKQSKEVTSKWHYFRLKQYTPSGDNMSRTEIMPNTVTFFSNLNDNQTLIKTSTQEKIYDAIEALQDNINKISQQRIADHASLSLRTVIRHCSEAFKWLIKEYNDGLKTIQPKRSIKPIEATTDAEKITHSIVKSIAALHNRTVTKETIAEQSGLNIKAINTNWSKSLTELVTKINSKNIKSEIIIREEEDEYSLIGIDHRNKLNPLTDESKFDRFISDLQNSRLYNHRQKFGFTRTPTQIKT